ncbi:flagellar basal-body rod protein FlgF [Rhizobium sp. NRK18]|jgi:flagellar basal-body rod protein FlgF|uniref:flagellar basal-body rod protein FlgF n=1 Tax=Rhizobium sp. NRK18 TaxID=2964667 RepID=UPI0021C2AC25|nr:flagellar basal-body rod protein FlgF [Rhizobium sp. NRK18]MCQ2005347.1 flagellar basal-body rod protein FlgF [Rhizobium sp. NRK18]
MQTGLYVALSSQVALDRRLTTIADNLANVNTTGFRATEIKFDDVMSQTAEANGGKIAFVSQGTDYLATRPGELAQTGDTFDFAIRGDGWFAIDTPAGQVLTRDGRFTIREDGSLVSSRGYAVLDPGGGAIQLNREGGPPQVGADGSVFQDGKLVNKIGTFTIDITKGFSRYENSGIIPADRPRPTIEGESGNILQGYLENSNVNGIREMTQLIEVNRAFENIAALTTDSESSMDEAIKTLAGTR